MKTFNVILLLLLFKSLTFSQSFFSVIPDFGGDEMEGRLYNVIPLENEIKLIGLVHDSIVPGFDGGDWPILGTISYDGEYLGSNYLTDSLYSDGFYYITRRLAFKNDSICYLFDRRDLGSTFLDAYLIELDLKKGKIIQSKIIYDGNSNTDPFVVQNITLDKNGNLYLVNIAIKDDVYTPTLTVLDSNFIVLSQILIPNFGRRNFTKYMEVDEEGNIILIGISMGAPNSVWFESKLFRQVLDKDFNSVEFRLAATNIDHTIVTGDTYSIIKSNNGDWVCATQLVLPTSDCQDCSIWIPYVVCISNDFKEVRWETRMFDGNINSDKPFYFSNAITEVSDGYIFAGSSDGAFGIETSGILGKVGFNGDSLWLKHYVPVEWDTVQGRWFIFHDIKTTPAGNIVVGGEGSDRYTHRILPWILQLDKDGCLEPGCNTTSTSEEDNLMNDDLSIYPNPASDQCSIHFHGNQSSSSCYTLKIISDNGILIKEFDVLNQDVQYLVDLKNWTPGIYFAQVMDQQGRQLSRKFVVSNKF